MKKVIAYVHSHWDREWYREFEEFRLRLIEVFDEVLDALENNELPCFYFDGQTAAIEDYLEIFPEKEEKIKKLIKDKKLRVGPFYCSADSFLVSGESYCRNLEIGIKKAKELGETEFIGYLSDTFGHSSNVPYVLKSFDIDKACLWRGLGDLPADLNWDGIDVVYLIQGYYQDFLNSSSDIYHKAKLLKKYIDKIALKSTDNILLPIGADHLAIAKNLNYQITELNKIYKDYKIKISTPFEYFKLINKRKAVKGEFLNNTLNFILPGVYSSRIYIKQANIKSQWLLQRITEPLQSIGSFFFNVKDRQRETDYAYKLLIKNHAHDSIYGCCTDKVQNEVMTRFDKVNTVCKGIIKRTLRDLNSEKSGSIAVLNLSENSYSGKVHIKTNKQLPEELNAVKIRSCNGFTDEKLYNINEIPVTEDYTQINEYLIDVKNLPPFSIVQITKDNIYDELNLKTSANSIENSYIKLEIKRNNIIVTDKKRNEIYKDFITIIDYADIGDSYNFGALKDDKPIYAEIIGFKLKEKNRIRAVLSFEYKLSIPAVSTIKGRSKKKYLHRIKIDAILYNQSEYIEFKVKFVNRSKNHILKIGFNLKEKITKTINEDLFGTVVREFNPDFDIYKKIPAKKGIEIKPNTSPMQKFIAAQNFLLMSKGNCEYEINRKTLNLTLLRAVGIISNPYNTTRGTPAGPPLEAEGLQCTGENYAEFAFAFENKKLSFYKLTDEFYGSQISLTSSINKIQFIEKSNELIQIRAIKKEGKNLVLRLFNNSDKRQQTEITVLKYKNKICLKPYEIKNIVIMP